MHAPLLKPTTHCAMREPALPVGCVVQSSGLEWMMKPWPSALLLPVGERLRKILWSVWDGRYRQFT